MRIRTHHICHRRGIAVPSKRLTQHDVGMRGGAEGDVARITLVPAVDGLFDKPRLRHSARQDVCAGMLGYLDWLACRTACSFSKWLNGPRRTQDANEPDGACRGAARSARSVCPADCFPWAPPVSCPFPFPGRFLTGMHYFLNEGQLDRAGTSCRHALIQF